MNTNIIIVTSLMIALGGLIVIAAYFGIKFSKLFFSLQKSLEDKLDNGLDKSNATVTDILQRLAVIDNSQHQLNNLSTNINSLQQILTDKRSRGAFGEVQLEQLISNTMPRTHFTMQYPMSNNCRCDCILFLPQPTGNLVIDSKFPLENYQKMTDIAVCATTTEKAEQAFKQDIKKHINDIANKYIIPGETADGAIMFIPAEAVFAEIHAHHNDLVAYAQKSRVWLASPTTLMALLTTASGLVKDASTREHIAIMQKQLKLLAQDFTRFDDRIAKLSKHIAMTHDDIQKVQTSADKISKRFTKIEQVDIPETEDCELI